MVDRYIQLFEQVVSGPSLRISWSIVPPPYIADELIWTTLLGRVVAGPMASFRRVATCWALNIA